MNPNETAVGDIIRSYLRKNRKLQYGIRTCEALALWEKTVDEYTGLHTQPLHIKDRIMYVKTDSAPLANELALRERELVQSINKELDMCIIDRMVFKSGRIQRKEPEKKIRVPRRKITVGEAKKIDEAVECLREDDLRDAFRRFLVCLARRRGKGNGK